MEENEWNMLKEIFPHLSSEELTSKLLRFAKFFNLFPPSSFFRSSFPYFLTSFFSRLPADQRNLNSAIEHLLQQQSLPQGKRQKMVPHVLILFVSCTCLLIFCLPQYEGCSCTCSPTSKDRSSTININNNINIISKQRRGGGFDS